MDNKEFQENRLTLDNERPIQVTVNSVGMDEDEIDLAEVFHDMKLKWRIYAWVLVFCIVVGACAPLLLYQFTKEPLTVSSVVTLKYDIVDPRLTQAQLLELEENGEEVPLVPVSDLTAPDGTALDLNQVISSYVLQTALDSINLSQPIGMAQLRSNISIQRVLTEDSAQQQSLVNEMVENKSAGGYEQAQDLTLKYTNTFVVTLRNGFGDEDSRKKIELSDTELRQLLGRVLQAYNEYLMTTYADETLPVDEISMVETDDVDILEALDQLSLSVDNLYNYCDATLASTKAYRSWQTGRSLTDWMETLRTLREASIDYLYSDVFANSITKDRDSMLLNYRYELQEKQTELDAVYENIATVKGILEDYKNDKVYVSMQESDSVKSTMSVTDYYNKLILEQPVNYEKAAKLETEMAELKDMIASLEASDKLSEETRASNLARAEEELSGAIESAKTAFAAINAHMEEFLERPINTTFVEYSAALGKQENFLTAAMKNILIGIVAGFVVGLGLWFLSGFGSQFRRKKPDDEDVKKTGREAAER